eukprot:2019243-Prymnesium_polylepis.1
MGAARRRDFIIKARICSAAGGRRAPAWWIAEGTAVNEKALASTASPGCTPRHFRAMKSAEPHELKPTQYLKPVYSERAASASATSESTPG